MDSAKLSTWYEQAQPILVAFGLKVIGAVVVFMIGRWLIHLVTRLIGSAMTRQELDPSVQRYLVSFITVALNIILVVAILGYFGVETTSFAALVAGAGVAIGVAWSGMLGNFAAGIFFFFAQTKFFGTARSLLAAFFYKFGLDVFFTVAARLLIVAALAFRFADLLLIEMFVARTQDGGKFLAALLGLFLYTAKFFLKNSSFEFFLFSPELLSPFCDVLLHHSVVHIVRYFL